MLLCFLDLDHMKHINDSYGHAEGDNALVSAAGILRKVFRASDIIARWGGDEFVVLVRGASLDQAETLATQIRDAVADPIDVGAATVQVELTLGVAHSTTGVSEETLARSDHTMLGAKADAPGSIRRATAKRAGPEPDRAP